MVLLSAALGILAVVAASASVVIVRRRRAVRGPALSLGKPRGPAGVNHLATRVSELSDAGFHLHAGALHRRSLGDLLGSSSGASR